MIFEAVSMKRDFKVLLTGGAGFIGSHLAERLLADGCRVVVLDNLYTGKLKNIKRCLDDPNFHFIKGDIRDKKVVDMATVGVDIVIHQAAITSVPLSIRNPKLTHDVNVAATVNLLKLCKQKGVRRFIFASSAAVYGAAKKVPISESAPTKPLSPYGESKLRVEKYCQKFWSERGLETVCLRYFNVFGPRQPPGQYAGVISRFFDRLKDKLPPIIYGDGEQTRDFVYVDDVVEATVSALGCGEAAGKILNIGTGKATSINQLSRIFMKLMRCSDIEPKYAAPRVGDVRHSQADITKAKEVLGYKPRVSLERGLEKFIEWKFSTK
jgi:nucleoside-diphosphate-sugar epimerase